jgi:hypothetical protein
MHTYTASEYWAGHGALVHIDVTGKRDVDVPESVRVYLFGGTQHPLGPFELSDHDTRNEYRGQYPFNWMDYRPLMRAALVNLDRWVSAGEAAPPSRYPRLDDGTAVSPEKLMETFCALPGVALPEPLRSIRRLDFGSDTGVATHVPPIVGTSYPCLVPAVDQDGNEVCGIRLPFLTVPLATYTGWNRRHADIGGAGQVLATGGATGGTLTGATLPFPSTREARETSGDPRPSIAERYASQAAYVEEVKKAAERLIQERYMLAEDLEDLLGQATQHYDQLRS